MWDLRDYSFKKTVPTYETIEDVRVIYPGTRLASYVQTIESKRNKRKDGTPAAIWFLTVGERGIVRIWSSERYLACSVFTIFFCYVSYTHHGQIVFLWQLFLPQQHPMLV